MMRGHGESGKSCIPWTVRCFPFRMGYIFAGENMLAIESAFVTRSSYALRLFALRSVTILCKYASPSFEDNVPSPSVGLSFVGVENADH